MATGLDFRARPVSILFGPGPARKIFFSLGQFKARFHNY